MRVYISGPMTGIPEYNREEFILAEIWLKDQGHEVVNPWRLGEVKGWGHFEYMRRDIAAMAPCDAIFMLPRWWTSRGARKEWLVARLAFGMKEFN